MKYIETQEFKDLPYSIRLAYIKGACKYWMENELPFTLESK